MSPILSTTLGRSVVAITCAACLVFVSTRIADTQGVSATAKVAKPDPVNEELDKLRQQLGAMERRVAELEKMKPGAGARQDDNSANQGRLDKIEQRLGSLERARPSNNADSKTGMTVTAPFSVVDRMGLPLLRVGEAEAGGNGFSRGLYVLGAGGKPVAHVGSSGDGGGRIYAATPGSARPDIQMFAGKEGPVFLVSSGSKDSTKIDKGGIFHYNAAQQAIVVITNKDQKGLFEIMDASGAKMVEAGSLNNQKGYVLVTPWRASTALTGDPSVLRGGK